MLIFLIRFIASPIHCATYAWGLPSAPAIVRGNESANTPKELENLGVSGYAARTDRNRLKGGNLGGDFCLHLRHARGHPHPAESRFGSFMLCSRRVDSQFV